MALGRRPRDSARHELQPGNGYSVDEFCGARLRRRSRRNAAAVRDLARRTSAAILVQASVRHDHNSQFGGATTGNVAWGWQAAMRCACARAWGQGFRAPNFNELYYPGFEIAADVFLFAGNPVLEPERSRSAEAGLDWRRRSGTRVGLSLYRTRIERPDRRSPVRCSQAINIGRAAIDGARARLPRAARPRCRARPTRPGWMRATPAPAWRCCARADARLRCRRLPIRQRPAPASTCRRLSRAAGRRRRRTAAATCASTCARRRRWRAAGRIEARLENLGDRDYELVSGYNTPGRSGVLSLRWQAQ